MVADLTGIDVSDISHAGSFHDPLASVVLGTGKMLTDFKLLRKISLE